VKPERRAIAVFCGSRDGAKPAYRDAATAFGRAMASRGVDLVYGGAANGLMGAVADAVLAGGCRALGVIPKGLDRVEFAHPRLTERVDVRTMHERKAVMADRCDAFVALPGGFGTMDELFEAITWRQLSIHEKPIGLLEVAGYYAPLVAWLDQAVAQQFAPAHIRAGVVVDADPGRLIDALLGGA
jgi:uncharacterized protein (TIGR00730 family)